MDMKITSSSLDLYPRSLVVQKGIEYGLARMQGGQILAILSPAGSTVLTDFEGESSELYGHTLMLCPLNNRNAVALRTQLPWLRPKPLGLNSSFGFGDRLGIATPGHVRAMRETQAKVAPIFAQQSMREMLRTRRSPGQVLDEATWGIFEEGWNAGTGSDADHLKTNDDIDMCLAAGYTMFTFDPGAYVNPESDRASTHQLKEQIKNLPARLQISATGLLNQTINFEGFRVELKEKILTKAIAKYSRAIMHVASLFEHLQKMAGNRLYEVEISMDETEEPTSPAEHVYLASELKRFGVKWVSFAPRFLGRFEKGVDYIGDLRAFEADLAIHAAIARMFGPYKLSLHSGSDKFSLYPILLEKTAGLAHIKTAGTSYLEALRTIAELDQPLFKEIYIFALKHYGKDKQSYHVSAQTDRAPTPDQVTDWPGLLNQFDAREILHVTFGSVLTEGASPREKSFYDRIMATLSSCREAYFDNLFNHFRRHLEPFTSHIDG